MGRAIIGQGESAAGRREKASGAATHARGQRGAQCTAGAAGRRCLPVMLALLLGSSPLVHVVRFLAGRPALGRLGRRGRRRLLLLLLPPPLLLVQAGHEICLLVRLQV